jgi:hypothetical protein
LVDPFEPAVVELVAAVQRERGVLAGQRVVVSLTDIIEVVHGLRELLEQRSRKRAPRSG